MARSTRTLASAIGWSAIDTWGSALFQVGVMIVLARLLEPRAFGLVAMAGVYIAFVQVFVEQGLGAALVQRRELERAHLDTAFWIAVLMSMVLLTISLMIAPWVATLYGEPHLVLIVRWLSLGLVVSALNGTQRAILQRELAFRELAIRSLIAAVIGGVVGIGAALAGLGVWSLVIQTLTTAVIGMAVLWSVSDWRPAFRISTAHFRDLWGFSTSVLGTNLLTFVNRHSDDLIIGAVLGPVALGYYSVAYGLLRKMTTLLVGVSTKVAFPAFARVQHDPVRMRKGFYMATRYTSLIAFPAFIGILLVAPELVRGIYGPKWIPSIPVMQILALIGIIHSVFYFNGTVILSAGKPRWRLGLAAVNAVSNVVAFAIAVRWGIVAVAVAYVVRGYLVSPLPIWLIHRLIRIDVRMYLRQYVVPLVGSAAMAATVLLLRHFVGASLKPAAALGLYVAAGGLVYTLAVYLRAPDTWRDLVRTARGRMPTTANPAPTNPA